MSLRDLQNWLHITGLAAKLDGDDCFGLGGNGPLNAIGIDVKGIGETVDQNRSSFEIQYYLGRSGEGHGRNNHFIALLNSNCLQCEMKRRCARIYCDCVTTPDILCEILLELFDFDAGCQPTRLKRLDD